jgi:hypothetical protein
MVQVLSTAANPLTAPAGIPVSWNLTSPSLNIRAVATGRLGHVCSAPDGLRITSALLSGPPLATL